MNIIGTIEDIYHDEGYVKFRLEEPELDYVELPFELFTNIKVDSRYKIILTELPKVDRQRED